MGKAIYIQKILIVLFHPWQVLKQNEAEGGLIPADGAGQNLIKDIP
jgi:hypothetical protein